MTKRILIIDDEEFIRDSFELALEPVDVVVETASNGEEGIKKAQQNPPDLIFLDMKMPGINGVETLRRLLAHDNTLIVHILTAFYEEFIGPLRNAMAEGLRFEISSKPLNASQIRMIVNGYVDGPSLSRD